MSTFATASVHEKGFVETAVDKASACSLVSGAHAVVAYALFPAVAITTAAVYGAAVYVAQNVLAPAISEIFTNNVVGTIAKLALSFFAGAAVTTAIGFPITFSAAVTLSGTVYLSFFIVLLATTR